MAARATRAKRAIESVSFYYLLAVGFLSVRYDLDKCEARESFWRTAYVYCANVALVLAMPAAVMESHAFLNSVNSNELLRQTDTVSMHIVSAVALLIILTRRRREQRIGEIMAQVFTIQRKYFARLAAHADIERHYDRILRVKFASAVSMYMVTTFLTLVVTPIDFRALLITLYYVNTAYLLHGLVYYYFSAMLEASKHFAIIDREMESLQRDLQLLHAHCNEWVYAGSCTWRQLMRQAGEEVRCMAQVHWKVASALQSTTETYQWLIIAVQLTYTLQTISFGYFEALIYGGSLTESFSLAEKLIGVILYLVVFLDSYIFYWMCDQTTRTYRRISWTLKRFQGFPQRNAELEHQCESFALQVAQQNFSIHLGGMYAINMQTFIVLWGFILQHVLFLVQSDYSTREHP